MKAGGTHMDNMECQLAKTSIWLTKAVTVLFHMIAGKISTSLCSYWPPSDFDRLKHTFPRFPNQRMSVAARCLLHLKDQSTYSVVNNPVCKVPIVPFTAGNISKITILPVLPLQNCGTQGWHQKPGPKSVRTSAFPVPPYTTPLGGDPHLLSTSPEEVTQGLPKWMATICRAFMVPHQAAKSHHIMSHQRSFFPW